MAILLDRHPIDSAVPLNQITNEVMAGHTSQDSYEGSLRKTVRRTRPMRSLRRQLESSESYELGRGSIYSAYPALSRESLPESSKAFAETRKSSVPATLSSPCLLELYREDSQPPIANGHRRNSARLSSRIAFTVFEIPALCPGSAPALKENHRWFGIKRLSIPYAGSIRPGL